MTRSYCIEAIPADWPRISPSVSSDVVVVDGVVVAVVVGDVVEGEVGGGDGVADEGVVGVAAVDGAVAGVVVSGEVIVVLPPQPAISNVVINRRAISPAIILLFIEPPLSL
ncbi:hypothetical protein ACFLVK_00345 [Chloroflexota bacterium]